jgi:LPXTG-motif cell wall-anchored protein
VPSVCRRIVVLLVVALLGVGGPVTAAYAQGAGDQQYQDPFGNDDSGTSTTKSKPKSGSGDDDIAPLSQAPQTSGSGSSGTSGSGTSGTSSGTAGTTASGTPTTSATAGTLPNTGLDTRVLLLAGGVLVLLGVGLRMRNAPERF